MAAMRLRTFFHQLFTERDNHTADLKRVLWALGFVWGLALESYAVVLEHRLFDLVTFSIGMGGLLAAGGATLALNRRNENGAPPPEAGQ